jgi:hypothetical protein
MQVVGQNLTDWSAVTRAIERWGKSRDALHNARPVSSKLSE